MSLLMSTCTRSAATPWYNSCGQTSESGQDKGGEQGIAAAATPTTVRFSQAKRRNQLKIFLKPSC